MANGKLVHNSDKINVQNLGKRSKEPILRQSMRAKQGHLVIGTDSSNIEVRVLSFLANQQDVIDVFRSGRDVYIDMATKIYNKSYDEIYEVSKRNPTKEGKLMRNIAKAVVLGCGYGASAAKFAELMKQQGLAEQADMADTLINTYRSSNNKVSEFWNTTQQALEVMAMGGDMWFGGADGKLLYADGRSEFHGVVIPSIKFPDGTYLYYQGLRYEADETGRIGLVYDQFKGRNWVTTRIWGSKAVENITQKLAFDILKYQAIKITERGVPVNLNVHDEWVSVVPVEHAPHAIKAHAECMREVPEYIPDGLLDCEVDVGWNYGTTNTLPI